MKKRGIFVVIDGSDGTGKATQTELLVKELKKRGKKIEQIDFPQYGTKSAGMVEEYLNGKYGGVNDVSAKISSIFFAMDRYDASFKIRKWLEAGKVVISNRYVSSNMGHQAGKIKNLKKRNDYLKWLDELEFEFFNIPRPDLTILLYMSPKTAQTWVDKKGKREYIKNGGKRDIHENDIQHLINATKAYKYVAKKFDWPIVKADQTREKVHEDIMKHIDPLLQKKTI